MVLHPHHLNVLEISFRALGAAKLRYSGGRPTGAVESAAELELKNAVETGLPVRSGFIDRS